MDPRCPDGDLTSSGASAEGSSSSGTGPDVWEVDEPDPIDEEPVDWDTDPEPMEEVPEQEEKITRLSLKDRVNSTINLKDQLNDDVLFKLKRSSNCTSDVLAPNKLPYFDGSNYSYYKNIIVEVLAPTTTQRTDQEVPEENATTNIPAAHNAEETRRRRAAHNAKAKHLLYYSLSMTEYNKICTCVTVKEIWNLPKLTYEGTDRVKEMKLNIFLRQYELFKMKSDETVAQMFNRFTDIVNGLAHQEKIFTNGEKVNKLLRALPKEWNNVKTSVRETTRIQPITLEELIGTFPSDEVEQQIEEGSSKGKKAIAFKANNNDAGDILSSEHERDDEDMALFTRKKLGHIKPDCPLLKKKRGKYEKKKKALNTETWSESECETSDEEEANLYLMADSDHEEEDEVIQPELSYEEIQDFLKEMFDEYRKALKRISIVRKEVLDLTTEKLTCKIAFDNLKKDYDL
ncbi:uncharacterized protein LOC130136781 [Syzygium oleosum]|uniref:uncharacterized protein LOC130136781 n=1 Tax=Syzygium oleosum TaxID=219896 RepID=UPI0024BA03C6|nr:uncharacterized protein LOC130136781 [Syzygium oleosum]